MYRRIKSLVRKKYIEPHPGNKKLRTTYYRTTVLTESLFSNIGKKSDISEINPKHIGNKSDTSENNPKYIGKKSVRVSDENPKDNNTINNTTINNNGKKLLPKFSFDSFWNKYNYKKNKQQALKAWKKLKDQDKEKAIKAVDGYLTYLQAKNHPQCHASTWLNNRRFEDDNTTEQKQGETKITQEQAKEELIHLYRAYKNTEIWKKKYANQAQSDYIKALNLFYLENPKLKDNGPTTS